MLSLTGRPVQEYPALKGMADLAFTARGGPRPVVNGYLLAGICSSGTSRSTVGIYFSWKDGKIHLSDARLQKGREELVVSGVIGNEGLDLAVTADGFSLSALEIPGYNQELTGFLKLDAKIKGAFASPVISGKVEADQLNIAGFPLEKVTGKVQWKEEVLSIEEMKVFRGSQELQAYGEFDFKDEPAMNLELWLEKQKPPNFYGFSRSRRR